MELLWSDYTNSQYLTVGNNPAVVATISKHKTFWSVRFELNGIRPVKPYLPLDQRKAEAESLVRDWFEQALAPNQGAEEDLKFF